MKPYKYLYNYAQNPYKYQSSLYHEGNVLEKCL